MVDVKPEPEFKYNPLNDVFTPEEKQIKKDFIRENIGKIAYIYLGKNEVKIETTLEGDHLRMVDIGWIQKVELKRKKKK